MRLKLLKFLLMCVYSFIYLASLLSSLFLSSLHLSSLAGVFERRLGAGERPLDIQETVRKHGKLESFNFIFKAKTEADESDNEGSSEEDEESTGRVRVVLLLLLLFSELALVRLFV